MTEYKTPSPIERCPQCGSDSKSSLSFNCFRGSADPHPWHWGASEPTAPLEINDKNGWVYDADAELARVRTEEPAAPPNRGYWSCEFPDCACECGHKPKTCEYCTWREAPAAKPEPPTRVSLEVYQHDWIPGFAGFHDDGDMDETARAHVVLNLGSLLATVESGELPAKDLPYMIAESLMHEAIHALEAWAKVEFSEERVEALTEQYRRKYRPDDEKHWQYDPDAKREQPTFEAKEPAAPQDDGFIAPKDCVCDTDDLRPEAHAPFCPVAKRGASEPAANPVPMRLFCPKCGVKHIDEGEWATRHHKTHQCQSCKYEWRPYEYATVGIEEPAAKPEAPRHSECGYGNPDCGGSLFHSHDCPQPKRVKEPAEQGFISAEEFWKQSEEFSVINSWTLGMFKILCKFAEAYADARDSAKNGKSDAD